MRYQTFAAWLLAVALPTVASALAVERPLPPVPVAQLERRKPTASITGVLSSLAGVFGGKKGGGAQKINKPSVLPSPPPSSPSPSTPQKAPPVPKLDTKTDAGKTTAPVAETKEKTPPTTDPQKAKPPSDGALPSTVTDKNGKKGKNDPLDSAAGVHVDAAAKTPPVPAKGKQQGTLAPTLDPLAQPSTATTGKQPKLPQEDTNLAPLPGGALNPPAKSKQKDAAVPILDSQGQLSTTTGKQPKIPQVDTNLAPLQDGAPIPPATGKQKGAGSKKGGPVTQPDLAALPPFNKNGVLNPAVQPLQVGVSTPPLTDKQKGFGPVVPGKKKGPAVIPPPQDDFLNPAALPLQGGVTTPPLTDKQRGFGPVVPGKKKGPAVIPPPQDDLLNPAALPLQGGMLTPPLMGQKTDPAALPSPNSGGVNNAASKKPKGRKPAVGLGAQTNPALLPLPGDLQTTTPSARKQKGVGSMNDNQMLANAPANSAMLTPPSTGKDRSMAGLGTQSGKQPANMPAGSSMDFPQGGASEIPGVGKQTDRGAMANSGIKSGGKKSKDPAGLTQDNSTPKGPSSGTQPMMEGEYGDFAMDNFAQPPKSRGNKNKKVKTPKQSSGLRDAFLGGGGGTGLGAGFLGGQQLGNNMLNNPMLNDPLLNDPMLNDPMLQDPMMANNLGMNNPYANPSAPLTTGTHLGQNHPFDDGSQFAQQSLNQQDLPMDNLPMDNLPMDNLPMDNLPMDNFPMDNLPMDNFPMDNLPVNNLAPSMLDPYANPNAQLATGTQPGQGQLLDDGSQFSGQPLNQRGNQPGLAMENYALDQDNYPLDDGLGGGALAQTSQPMAQQDMPLQDMAQQDMVQPPMPPAEDGMMRTAVMPPLQPAAAPKMAQAPAPAAAAQPFAGAAWKRSRIARGVVLSKRRG